MERSEEAGWEGLEVFCGCSVFLCHHIEQCSRTAVWNIVMLSSAGGQQYNEGSMIDLRYDIFKVLPLEMRTRS